MKLSWTERALVDLAGIDQWLSEQADRPLAIDQLDKIRLRARRLRDFPTLGRPLGRGARTVSVARTPYILVYRIIDDVIEILRVHHNRQNWQPPE